VNGRFARRAQALKTLVVVVSLLAAALVGVVVTATSASASPIGGKRAALLSPFSGSVSWGESAPEHVDRGGVANGYGFSWDLRGGASAAVYPHVVTGDGTLTMQVTSVADNTTSVDTGKAVVVAVKVDGVLVGTLRFAHLVNVQVDTNNDDSDGKKTAVTASTILGYTADDVSITNSLGTCKGFACSSYWIVSTTLGIHTHVDFKQACYGAFGSTGTVDSSTGLVLLSQNYGTANNSTCDGPELANVAAGTSSTPASDPNADIAGNIKNGTQLSMAGHWVSGDAGQDFIYITRDSDGGFSVAAWKSISTTSTNKIAWAGNYWQQDGPHILLKNTVFFGGDANGDGLEDLYYATHEDWNTQGFTVGVMINNGHGLGYGGPVWTSNNLYLKSVKFLAGDWTGSGKQGFAYVDPTSDGGFEVAVVGVNASNNFYATNVWFTQPGPDVSFGNTQFTALDADGDGRMDLYYSSAVHPDNLGFTTSYLHNSGSSLDWVKPVWTPSNVALNSVKFIPGYWAGGTREGYMAVVRRSDNGFDTYVYTPDANGNLQSDNNVWWSQPGPGVEFSNTRFVPADMDNDGETDLFYATATNWDTGLYSLGLFHNDTGVSTGFHWVGNQGDTGHPLNQTVFGPMI